MLREHTHTCREEFWAHSLSQEGALEQLGHELDFEGNVGSCLTWRTRKLRLLDEGCGGERKCMKEATEGVAWWPSG